MAAVGGFLSLQGTLILSLQESRSYSYINVIPGQGLVRRAVSLGVKAGFKPGLVKGAEPIFILEMLAPGIKGAAQLPGTIDNFT